MVLLTCHVIKCTELTLFIVYTEKVVALYPYSALNEDELSFEKDDVIILLAREEASWWRGELKGVSGLFPSNYVAPLCEYSCLFNVLI
jgi:hypothetical protein